ncbi:eukaryotic translation initiation factor 6, partial [Aureobasidium melanogenum]
MTAQAEGRKSWPHMTIMMVEAFDDTLLVGVHAGIETTGAGTFAESEDALDDAQLSGGGVHPRHGQPVVDNHTGTDDGASSIDGSGDQGHLQQRTQFVLVLDAGLGMDNATLVRQRHVRPRQHVPGNGLSKHFDAEGVCDDFLRFSFNVRVHERHVVVGRDAVAQS